MQLNLMIFMQFEHFNNNKLKHDQGTCQNKNILHNTFKTEGKFSAEYETMNRNSIHSITQLVKTFKQQDSRFETFKIN